MTPSVDERLDLLERAFDELKGQVRGLSGDAAKDSKRLAHLEVVVGVAPPALKPEVPETSTLSLDAQPPLPPPEVVPDPVIVTEEDGAAGPPSVALEIQKPERVDDPTPQPGPRKDQPSLETKIGRYWLNRIGVVSVVIGLAYLLAHTYQNFGPGLKIALGFLSASGLLAAGDYIGRKKDFSWYGQGLIGGGYALLYFVVYAMQNIASVQLIDEPILAACGLLAVAATSMVHATGKKSEAIALLSTLLAFATISLSPVTWFSLVATAVLVAGLSAVIMFMHWRIVYFAGALGSYLTYLLFTQPGLASSSPESAVLMGLGFLGLFWVAFTTLGFRLFTARPFNFLSEHIDSLILQGKTADKDESAWHDKLLLAVGVVNVFFFVFLGLTSLTGDLASWRGPFLLASGALYGLTALWGVRSGWRDMALFGGLTSLALASASVPLFLEPRATSIIWLLEVPLLLWGGQRLSFRSFRWFAHAIALLCTARFLLVDLYDASVVSSQLFNLGWNVLYGVTAVVSLAASSLILRRAEPKGYGNEVARAESTVTRYLYTVVSCSLLWILTMTQASTEAMPLVLAGEALGIFALASFKRGNKEAEIYGLLFLGSAALAAIASSAVSAPITLAAVVLSGFGVSMLYRRRILNLGSPTPDSAYIDMHHATWVATSLALIAILANRLDSTWVPISVMAVAMPLASIGMVLRDKVLRTTGYVAATVTIVALAFSVPSWSWASALPVVSSYLVLYLALRYLPLRDDDRFVGSITRYLTWLSEGPSGVSERDLTVVFRIAFAVSLTALLMALLSWQSLAVAWAMEGALLLAIGFSLKDKQFRHAGLVVFGLLICKLALYDLRDADTVARIVSFIVGGLTLLGTSYAYGYFEKRLGTDASADNGNDDLGGGDTSAPTSA